MKRLILLALLLTSMTVLAGCAVAAPKLVEAWFTIDRVETDRVETDRVETDRIETDRVETDRVETDRVETVPAPTALHVPVKTLEPLEQPTPTATPISAATPVLSPEVEQVVMTVRQMLMQQVQADFDSIHLVSVESVEWPDGCLGLPAPDEMCTQMIVPGYRIVFAVDGQEYVYHTDHDGRSIRLRSAPFARNRLPKGATVSAPVLTEAEVIAAMQRVPRQRFVPEECAYLAQADQPLPIGYGQTISQPTMVAIMTELLRLRAGDRVLEIGTGSSYQAALLAELGIEVYSVEIIPALADKAVRTLHVTGYAERVHVRQGDGYDGWPDHAPYDAIIVTAAAPSLPPPLTEQLRAGGRIVIPIGLPERRQHLWVYEKTAQGNLRAKRWGEVAFVPFTRM